MRDWWILIWWKKFKIDCEKFTKSFQLSFFKVSFKFVARPKKTNLEFENNQKIYNFEEPILCFWEKLIFFINDLE